MAMMLSSLKLLALTGLLAVSQAQAQSQSSNSSDPAAACAALGSSLAIQNVTVNIAQYLTAGTNLTFTQSYNTSSCNRPSQIIPADLCRIAMRVTTSNRSEITLEAWLPTNWTGRFLSTGNGGISGCIQYEDIAYATQYGFAAVGGNNGHNGTAGLAFYNNPDIVADFAYRSIHTGVVVGKQVTDAYYGTPHGKSYYLGCSTGGRQGFKSVQDFPEDFDGVVVGAPALSFDNLTSWSGHFFTALGTSNSSTYLSPSLWSVVHNEVLKQCDGLDGVVDGIIEDPDLCHFRPEALLCSKANATNTTTCLTVPQIEAVRIVFSDYYGVNGSLIYPRMQPGGELVGATVLYNGAPFPYTTDWFRYAIYNDPTWDPAKLSIQDAAFAANKNPSNIETWKGNLTAFAARGGKILHYHGLQDSIISSDNSPRYYNHVARTMGMPSSELDRFYRFFRISGMGHCSGGPGAWQIGQTTRGLNGNAYTPETSVLARMVAWVERGSAHAPVTVRGTKFVNDNATQGVALVREHCKYPLRNVCIDPARNASSSAWKCVV